jgi:hypothetical protein
VRSRIFAKLTAFALAGFLTATGAARADEPAVQHHPDQALQHKLDELDHGSDTPGSTSPPDASQGGFPGSMRIPGTDTSIRVYGSGTETLRYSR